MTCDDCGGELVREIWELAMVVGPRLVSIHQPGRYCVDCGAAQFSASDLDAADRQLAALRQPPRVHLAPPAAKAA